MQTDPSSTPAASLLFQSATSDSNPSRSPRRVHTDPIAEQYRVQSRQKMYKRIIVFCDGTWQDGVATQERSKYTNVLRLARSVNHEDERSEPPVAQIVFYQSGVGSDNNVYSKYVEGATGESLGDKVEDAYAFIAHNYDPGDEIFLFGFSRGAYTARMVATFIGEIGVLDSKDMDNFASIFLDFQALGNSQDPFSESFLFTDDFRLLIQVISTARAELTEKLAPWRQPLSKGRLRASVDGDKFTIKCLGVWDTVGSIGLPEEMRMSDSRKANMFGFPTRKLGPHIENAYQALALNEIRKDFNCNKFKQTEAGRHRKQVLKQCWFAGSHSDIGGGYDEHDLSDITLVWMAAHIGNLMSIDAGYLANLLRPVAPWGKQNPHASATGIFLLADRIHRILPTIPLNSETHEYFHSSILEQTVIDPALSEKLKRFPDLIDPMLELEIEVKKNWPFDPATTEAQKYLSNNTTLSVPSAPTLTRSRSWYDTLSRLPSAFFQTVTTVTQNINGPSSSSDNKNSLATLFQTQTSEIAVVVDPGSSAALNQIGRGALVAGRA